jgi:GrpB-like predicted nucleotidyltransferase (UPF0157 family)/GNAT superfamily N-acetyltransferase/chloramphenicol 3-O-phosphotransferase
VVVTIDGMVRSGAQVYVVTGPMAAGKTTVARALASRFNRGVHLEGDVFRRSIVSGRKEVTPDPVPEALEQLQLRYRASAAAADMYAEEGFTVVVDDVIAGPMLSEYRPLIRHRPCHVVVLFPSLETVAAREAHRRQDGYAHWTVDELYRGFDQTTPRLGVWLDTSSLTVEETVNEILAVTPPPAGPLVIEDYDPEWPARFRELAVPIRERLAGVAVAVEHVGSTAVEGLAAKPVVDIDVVVRTGAAVSEAIGLLRSLGYTYQGDKGVPGREAFMWPPGSPPHHVYVVVEGSKPLVDHLEFRDYLRRHPEVTREYGALKRELAEQFTTDRVTYTDAKTDFIIAVLERARHAQGARLMDPVDDVDIREADAADAAALAEVYLSSAEHHRRLDPDTYRVPEQTDVLPRYESALADGVDDATIVVAAHGATLAGFVEVSMAPEPGSHSMLRPCRLARAEIAVLPGYRGGGVGRRLMGAAESWAASRGATGVMVDVLAANDGAYRFYASLGYRDFGVLLRKSLDRGSE